MIRLPLARPLLSALAMTAFGAVLLSGAGASHAPSAVPQPTSAGARAHAPAGEGSAGWLATLRDLVVGNRTGPGAGRHPSDSVAAGPAVQAGVDPVVLLAPVIPDTPVPDTPIVDTSVLDPSFRLPGASPGHRGFTNVPAVLWDAYRSAVASAPTSCRLPVQLLAAIGQVESGSLVGRSLDSRHRAVPAVLGPVLDGGSFAAIRDTDGGRYDGDTVWDRAVGPMQFIPSTWQRWGRDGNGDGLRDPQNVEDSAHSAAAYLCASGRDLGTDQALRAAILSYNHSDAYLADVLRVMRTVSPGGAAPPSVLTLPPASTPAVARTSGDSTSSPPRVWAQGPHPTSARARFPAYAGSGATPSSAPPPLTSEPTTPATSPSTAPSSPTAIPTTTRTTTSASPPATTTPPITTTTSPTTTSAPSAPTPTGTASTPVCPPLSVTATATTTPPATESASPTTPAGPPAPSDTPSSTSSRPTTTTATGGEATPAPCGAPSPELPPTTGLASVLAAAGWAMNGTATKLSPLLLVLVLATLSLELAGMGNRARAVASARGPRPRT